jgi:hypothetical protein
MWASSVIKKTAKCKQLPIGRIFAQPEGSFLNEFLRLREKLAPSHCYIDSALLAPRREVRAYASFKKLASGHPEAKYAPMYVSEASASYIIPV